LSIFSSFLNIIIQLQNNNKRNKQVLRILLILVRFLLIGRENIRRYNIIQQRKMY
jgi:hypothetical protein